MTMRDCLDGCKVPEEILHSCSEGDQYGIVGGDIWWWYEEKNRDYHLVPGENVEIHREKPLKLVLDFPSREVRNLIIHDGLGKVVVDFYRTYVEVEEVILPDTLRILPCFKGKIRKMRIPPSVEHFHLDDLFVTCDGRWDPVTYAVKQLILPSDVVFDQVGEEDRRGALPVCEEIYYWEEIVLYGEKKIPDLLMWYQANFFAQYFFYRYPRAWDEGKDGSYADELLAFVRAQNPMRPSFGMYPSRWVPYSEEEYQFIRNRIMPYEEE